ncbi:hypothetical protein [Nonomuraea sp. NPDC049400]|uniref:hypothetical protein n=1 Tax=Nonomuraea sp. NPDC049400 TaxID=3364352 RepID=UPI0037A6F277
MMRHSAITKMRRAAVDRRVVQEIAGLRVHLTDGSQVPAATVVASIGAVPKDRWLAGSGLAIDDGLYDQYSLAVGALGCLHP